MENKMKNVKLWGIYKKLVIFVDKRGFGVYPCFRRDKHCEIREIDVCEKRWLRL